MGRVTELRVHTRAPVTENKTIQVEAQGIILKNTGTTTATMNRHYTLLPGETLNLGVSNDINIIIVMDASFIFTGAGTNKIEILELRSNEERFTNYKRQ